MTTFYLLCGIPGSGKSYWAREQTESHDIIVSSDSIREELYGDASIRDAPSRVFDIMFQRTRAALKAGCTVYYDATNIHSKYRINLLNRLKKLFPKIEYVCVIIATPIDVCYKRNESRERKVPNEIISRMMKQFEVPCEAEGWDKIIVHYSYDVYKDYNIYRQSYAQLVEAYGEQGNSHHSLTLKEHCNLCGKIARDNNFSEDIVVAATIHDYGKICTATRWEKDNYQEIHYPNHSNASSYFALTMDYNLHIAQLVGLHMIPYMDKTAQDVWRKRMGQQLWKEVQLLHQADVEAH